MNPAFPFPLELLRRQGRDGFTGHPLYDLTADFLWVPQHKEADHDMVRVPRGFSTDLASTPEWMSAKGWRKAAVVHDYLCNVARSVGGALMRSWLKDADSCLYYAMLDDGAPVAIAYAYWAAVRAKHVLEEGF